MGTFVREFDFEVKIQKDKKNVVDHSSNLDEKSMIRFGDEFNNHNVFPEEYVLASFYDLIPWFAYFANYLESELFLSVFHSTKEKNASLM